MHIYGLPEHVGYQQIKSYIFLQGLRKRHFLDFWFMITYHYISYHYTIV